MESIKDKKYKTILLIVIWLLVAIALVGGVFALINAMKERNSNKVKYGFKYGAVGNVPNESGELPIDYEKHNGIVSELMAVKGLNLSLSNAEYSDLYCFIYCFDKDKKYGGPGLSYESGKTFIVTSFGGDKEYSPNELAAGTEYIVLRLVFSDEREIPEDEFDKVLSQLTITYE